MCREVKITPWCHNTNEEWDQGFNPESFAPDHPTPVSRFGVQSTAAGRVAATECANMRRRR